MTNTTQPMTFEEWSLDNGYFEEIEDSGSTTIVFNEDIARGWQASQAQQVQTIAELVEALGDIQNYYHKPEVVLKLATEVLAKVKGK